MRPLYLDHNASTPVDPRVVEAMLPFLLEQPGNASNTVHTYGRLAAAAVEDARADVARLVGAAPHEVVFTSGATESNNLALLGAVKAHRAGRRRLVTTAVEHKAVLEPLEALRGEGFDVVVLPVLTDGAVDLAEAARVIDASTLLVSIQAANNEVGTIQPVAEVARLTRAVGALVHTDATQAVGSERVNVSELDVDLLSMSAHKLYGPKGVGALYVRGGARSGHVAPLMHGGGQEGGLRPGTLNVPGVVGFGVAARMALDEGAAEARRIRSLRDTFESELRSRVPDARFNGARDRRLPGTSSLTFPGVEADMLIANLDRLALATGSACNSGAPEPSYVLTAMGLSWEDAYATVRIGFGRSSRVEDLPRVVQELARAYARLTTT